MTKAVIIVDYINDSVEKIESVLKMIPSLEYTIISVVDEPLYGDNIFKTDPYVSNELLSREMDKLFPKLDSYKDCKFYVFGKSIYNILTKNFDDNYDGMMEQFESNGYKFYSFFHQNSLNAMLQESLYFFLIDTINENKQNEDTKILNSDEFINKVDEILKLNEEHGNLKLYLNIVSEDYTNNIMMYVFSHDLDRTTYVVPLYNNDKTINIEITPQNIKNINVKFAQLVEKLRIVTYETNLSVLQRKSVIDVNRVNYYNDLKVTSYCYFFNEKEIDFVSVCKEFFTYINTDNEIMTNSNYYKDLKDIRTGILSDNFSVRNKYMKKLYNVFSCLIDNNDFPFELWLLLSEAVYNFEKIKANGIKTDAQIIEFLEKDYSKKRDEAKEIIFNLPTVKKYIEMRADKQLSELKDLFYAKKQNVPQKYSANVVAYYDKLKFDFQEKSNKIKNEVFSLNTDNCLRELLYEDPNFYKFKVEKRSKGGQPSLDKYTFEMLLDNENNVEKRQFLENLMIYNKFDRLLNSYISKYKFDYTFHNYDLLKTVTGRISSGFHIIPSRTSDVKRIFTTRWLDRGGLFLIADFSQLEIRIASGLSNEKNWIEAYNNEYDLHAITGAKINKIISLEATMKDAHEILKNKEIKDEMRDKGKGLNCAIIYDEQAKSVSKTLNVNEDIAQRFIDFFHESTPNLTSWKDHQKQFALENGYIINGFGRKIYLDSLKGRTKALRSKALREAVNYPIQSTGNDLVIWAINKINKYFSMKGLRTIIVGSVHDSILFDIYPNEIYEVIKILKFVCEVEASKFSWLNNCPMKIDINIGTSWGNALKVSNLEIDRNYLNFESVGMACDWEAVINTAVLSTNIEMDIVEEIKKDFTYYPIDKPIRDEFDIVGKVKIFA